MATIANRLRCEFLEARRLMAADVENAMEISVQSAASIDGVRAAEIRLQYDTQALDLKAADIQPSVQWKGSASLLAAVDELAGLVHIYVFSAEPLSANGVVGGELVDLQFEVSDGAVADVSSTAVTQLRLNEGAIEATPLLEQLSPVNAPTAKPSSTQVVTPVVTPVVTFKTSSVVEAVVVADVESPIVPLSAPQVNSDTAPQEIKACRAWENELATDIFFSYGTREYRRFDS